MKKVRYQAYCLVNYQNWSVRKAARYLSYAHNTVLRWVKEKPCYNSRGQLVIPTRSSRPHHHPRQLSPNVVSRILKLRAERHQCAEIIHHRLDKEGIVVSLSSVKRVLKRYGCSRYSKWKKWHQYSLRPFPKRPGVLVELDSLIEGASNERLCAYAMIDVCSRWAFAEAVVSPNSRQSVKFIDKTLRLAPFSFQCIQTDHGSEFSKWFTKILKHQGIKHRHSRVRRPTDNGYIERFIRTLQDECLHRIPRSYKRWQKEIPEYLHYYNTERPHMGLNFRTPLEVVRSY